MKKQYRLSNPSSLAVGYPISTWSDFPQSAMVQRWVRQLIPCWRQCALDASTARLLGVAALVEHDYPRNIEALARLIAAELDVEFQSIDPEQASLPEFANKFSGQLQGVVYLESGSWQEAEDGPGTPRSDTPVGRVRSFLEGNFESPTFIVITTCRNVEKVYSPLRRISGFSRMFELPCPSPEELGALFIASCDRAWLADDVVANPRCVGLLLASDYQGYEGRLFARLFAQRIAVLESRRVTLRDLASLDSVGSIESCAKLPTRNELNERVAWHEAGHAAVALADSNGRHIPEYLTVTPRRNTLGFMTLSREYWERRRFTYTQSMMVHEIRVCLAGRAVEEIIYGHDEVSDLCVDDLERAAETLRSGVLKYGFQFASARSVLPALVESSVSGEAAFRQVQSNPAWRGALEQEYEATMKTIQRNRPLIEAIQRRLLRDRVMFREEFEMIWSAHVRMEKALSQSAA